MRHSFDPFDQAGSNRVPVPGGSILIIASLTFSYQTAISAFSSCMV
jgi:hypothetical protein